MLGQLAGDLEGQRAHAAARELGEEPAEDLGQGQVRRDRPGRLRREQRGVDGVAGAPPVEDVEDLGRDLLGDEDLGLLGRGPEVRGQERVRRVEQRASRPGGSCSKTSMPAPPRCPDASASATAASSTIAAAGDVEDDRARAQLGDGGRAR